ncbi:MAG: hypothetical protein HFF52_05855 [Lawsonibacter sp.]|nr:hypothetical protein [Lawsonibacter sp.]
MEQRRRWTVAVWGTRGAVPMAAADFLEYGGNTSCISVDCGGELVVLDAGSGIIGLGEQLSRQNTPKKLHLLISHFHLDHITGLTGFRPLNDPTAEIHLYGEGRGSLSFQGLLEQILGPPYWPVGLRDFRSRVSFHEIAPGERFSLSNGLTVDTMRANHPNQSLIYRLEGEGRRIVYTLDCEMGDGMEARLAEFARNCGLLIWDANFAPADLIRGWGHSTWEQGAAVGREAGAAMVLMTHFSHSYTDEFLREQERVAMAADCAVRFAREGMEIVL